MAMLQQDQPPPNDNDSLNRSNKDVTNMEGTSNKQPPSEPTGEEAAVSGDLSHPLTISDSNQKKHPETRPEDSSTTVTVENTNHSPAIDPSSQSIRTSQTEQRNMKLIVRSQYWGRTLKGKTCRSIASLNRAYRTISSQAVLYNTDEYWGCCPHHGKRVLELHECHFQDAMPDQDWDLYSTGNWVSPNYCINEFFLLPQNQSIIDVSRNIILSGWSFVGTCTANSIQDDLDGMLRPWLSENDNFGFRYHHVHIEIMMEKAFDRETPRSRKVNNEKARQERQHYPNKTTVDSTQESSETTDDSGSSVRDGPPSTSGNPFVIRSSSAHSGPTPPIPHVISNDSSSVFSHSVASSVMPYHDGYGAPDPSSFWSPSAPPGMLPPTPNMGPSMQSPHPGMRWHPGSNHPLTSPGPHHHHQSWPSPSNLPPPPPPQMHGQLNPPSMNPPVLTDLQQFLMYAETLGVALTHNHGQHHYHHHQYYSNPTPIPLHQYQQQYPASYASVPYGAHVPSEILSSPTSAVPTFSQAVPTELRAPQLDTQPDGISNNNNTAQPPAPPSASMQALETDVATLSISNKDSTESVITTVASNTTVSSTCWSKVAAASPGVAAKDGTNTPSKKNGRLRLPTAD
ncbi:hypothetical protein IV203_034808 [Nitzschia inconspicua]|uniref:Uncharacterized protein n=1 Tax=Nitzschia inconspicua TaxID=303405 RepID=A0A9K3PTZ2_9STRA|nr:hypothetical protein IV203_034808 [Nitzschia inconspicua]